ncbi:MAG: hypothetical protein AB1632_07325 [Nitrospirota bacterium]
MIRIFLKRLLVSNKYFILKEASYINGFMHLLMKPKNTGIKWTKEEKAQLKQNIKHLSAFVPVLIIFLLPGGSLLLPFLPDILDRRGERRTR